MILINLLPYREAQRKRRKQAFFTGLGASALIGLAVAAALWALLQTLTDSQRQRNSYLEAENAKLDAQIKDIANLREEIEALTRRQKAVEALQAERNMPVNLLNELARLTPEGVYFTGFKQADKVVTLSGMAQTQERISEFLRNATRDSQWFDSPQLSEIKLAAVGTSAREAKRLFDFTIKVTLKGVAVEAAETKPGEARKRS